MKLCALLFVAVGTAGCVDQGPQLGSNQGESFEEYLSQVQREPGTGKYVLDWDIVVSTEAQVRDIWEKTQGSALSIYNVGGQDIKWNVTMQHALTYCVSNQFGANKPAVLAAMAGASDQGWELFADVNYRYDATQDATCGAQNQNVVFDVSPITGADYLARSFFPNTPRADRNVMIDSTAFDLNSTGGIPLTNILTHELGHTLGFRHEHIARPGQNLPGCVEDNDYRVIGTYDVVSTMHYPQCGSPGNTLALSAQDKTGVAAIYGAARVNTAPMAMLNAPQDGQTVAPNFTVDAAVVDDDLVSVDLFIDDVKAQTLAAGPFTFMVTGQSVGLHNLEIVATDSAGLITSKPFAVMVARGTGDGTGTGTGTGTGAQNPNEGADAIGGCSTGGAGGGGILVLLGLAGLVRRKRPHAA